MNFDKAIVSHSAWKAKLKAYLAKPDGSISQSEVQSDQKCELGKWIYGEGKIWSKSPAYITLKEQHAKFHAAAGAVIQKIEQEIPISEENAVGTRSDFFTFSMAVINAITNMKKEGV